VGLPTPGDYIVGDTCLPTCKATAI